MIDIEVLRSFTKNISDTFLCAHKLIYVGFEATEQSIFDELGIVYNGGAAEKWDNDVAVIYFEGVTFHFIYDSTKQ